jgi:recombination protein RecA
VPIRAADLKKFDDRFAKSFGTGRLVSLEDMEEYEVISTGSVALDYALGVGGLVEGRVAEYWGPDALGKTTLAILGQREAQEKHPDKLTAFIDVEGTFDKALALDLGLDKKRTKFYSPNDAEEVADAMKMVIQSGFYSHVVLDSIGAMIPEAEKEKDADEAVVALQAKIVTRMIKIAASEARRTKPVVLVLNQVRANVGGYGADTTTGGGWALKHMTTHKVKFRKTGEPDLSVSIDVGAKKEKVPVGHKLALLVERNKVAPPRRVAEITLIYQPSAEYGDRGVDKADEAFRLGGRNEVGVITRRGAWYDIVDSDGEKHEFNGRDNAVDWLRGHPEAVNFIRDRAVASVAHMVERESTDPAEDLDNLDAEPEEPQPKRAGFKQGVPGE